MSSQLAASYIESHAQLSAWNDDLEFLGFILAELADPRGLEANGFPWHQAADLPALVDTLRVSCVAETGTLQTALGRQTSKKLRKWLQKAKEIRNDMAHHQTVDKGKLSALQGVRDELCKLLEAAIRTVARYREVREIAWCPYSSGPALSESNTRGGNYRTETILLACGTEPLLSQRHRMLANIDSTPQSARKTHRRKDSTDKTQQKKAIESLIEAQKRKLNRRQQIKAKEEEIKAQKLRVLDQEYERMRQLRLAQLDRLRSLWEHEEKIWKIRRSALLQETRVSFSMDDTAVLAILALTSPLWLLCLLIRTLYGTCKALAGDT
ncbi:hypothetical protein BJX68DRAFT_267744 [Aspergillus pseudodeflectus]|uniref:Uncharacterized protein n=1 Tax=Aspergillus pseudodeflectus TaxID=176178 RepID=A0ABR4K7M0_9EURO